MICSWTQLGDSMLCRCSTSPRQYSGVRAFYVSVCLFLWHSSATARQARRGYFVVSLLLSLFSFVIVGAGEGFSRIRRRGVTREELFVRSRSFIVDLAEEHSPADSTIQLFSRSFVYSTWVPTVSSIQHSFSIG